MHVLCRKDPDPRKSAMYLLPGSSPGSQTATDYRFGLPNTEIEEYTQLADLYHGLILLRYVKALSLPHDMSRHCPTSPRGTSFPLSFFVEVLRVVNTVITFSVFIMHIHLVVVVGVRKNLSWHCLSGPTGAQEKRLSKESSVETS